MEIKLGPLVGVYSRADVRVVLVVFGARARRRQRDRRGDRSARVRAPDIPWHELAFWSTTAALRDALAQSGG